MHEKPVKFVKSKGAVIGVESYSGEGAFGRAPLSLGIISADCDVVAFAPLLGEELPFFSMDIRGQAVRGTEVAEDGGFTIEDYNADFDAVREYLGLEKIVLHGYSHAGFAAAHYALAHPERVEALILSEPSLFEDRANLYKWAELAEGPESAASIESMLRYVNPQLSAEELRRGVTYIMRSWQSPEMMGKAYRTRADNQLTARDLSNLKVPTLLIGGTESEMNHNIHKTAAAVPFASVWWVQGANHFDLVAKASCAPEIAAVVQRFVQSVATRRESVLSASEYAGTSLVQ
jgi:pimeloyl-ACP methyl ester carboxylesterase